MKIQTLTALSLVGLVALMAALAILDPWPVSAVPKKGGDKRGGGSQETRLTLVFPPQDYPASRIEGDGNPYLDAQDDVRAEIVPTGNIVMDTRAVAQLGKGKNKRLVAMGSRQLSFDFSQLVACPAGPCASAAENVLAFMSTTGCGVPPRDLSPPRGGDSDTLCELNFRLVQNLDPLAEVFLRFNPDWRVNGSSGTKVPVGCTGGDIGRPCTAWQITADPDDKAVLLDEGSAHSLGGNCRPAGLSDPIVFDQWDFSAPNFNPRGILQVGTVHGPLRRKRDPEHILGRIRCPTRFIWRR